MKTLKFILTMCLCALFAVSCSKDDDEDPRGSDPNDIPTGKVAFDKYGMRAFFPETGWGIDVDSTYLYGPIFQRECVSTYLKEDKTDNGYNTIIYFARFKEVAFNENDADSIFSNYSDFLKGKLDEGSNDPNLFYVDLKESASPISSYPATRIETISKSGCYQDNYLVYNNNNQRMYMVTISIADSLKNSQKYKDCMEIVNTLKLK